jgi:alpha-ketoglutarate-dependent taurine dioxygenase
MLGEVVVPPIGGDPAFPRISVISLDPGKDALAAYRKATFFWHIDGAQDEVPQKATLLAAHEIADEGGETEFANTYVAYEALPSDEQATLDGVRVLHTFAAAQLLVNPSPSPKQRAAWGRVPSREHPLVWARPNGRKSLLVGATAAEAAGRAPEDGRALLDHLPA